MVAPERAPDAAALEARMVELEAERDLERARLEALLEKMPSGVVIVEADGTTVPSARAAALLGPIGGSALEPLLVRGLAGESVVDEMLEIAAADGSRRVLEVSVVPTRRADSAAAAGAVAILHDVTARERRERAAREFVSNAAHELQTPLTAIASAVEVLQAGAKEIPADRDRFLRHAQDECDRLARLVRALLQLARAESGAEEPPREHVSARDLLTEVCERVRPRPGVELVVKAPARLRVYTNRDLAEQALINLVGNAAKYTARGSITLFARPLDAASAALEVADSGPGIQAADRYRVFERFFQGGVRSREGFGLGLAIAAQTARVLGGRIELDAQTGIGTVVRLILPRDSP